SFTVALAAELKDKEIKVTALCPGSVSTDFANVASNGARKEVLHGKDPVKVVSHCLKKSRQGSHNIVLWAAKWKATAFMSRFVSRYAGARFTYLFNKRPYKKN
ncbi:MAG: short-chain dehydrogenase, partial [Treponema sp.]|nr:short-chain dehydrogenase [Candidatus Treponema equifaecale]